MALIFECYEYISYRINTLSFAPNFLTYMFMYNIKRQVKLLHMFTKETVCTSLLPFLLFVFLLVGSYINWFIILKYIKIRCIQLSYCKIKIYFYMTKKCWASDMYAILFINDITSFLTLSQVLLYLYFNKNVWHSVYIHWIFVYDIHILN